MDYVTLANSLSKLLTSEKIDFTEVGRAGISPSTTFTVKAMSVAQQPKVAVDGCGAGKSLKLAKQEAARDYVFRCMKLHQNEMLKMVDDDLSYCSKEERLKCASDKQNGFKQKAIPVSNGAISNGPISNATKKAAATTTNTVKIPGAVPQPAGSAEWKEMLGLN